MDRPDDQLTCRHWMPGPTGGCGLGLFGGRPSAGTCRRCDVREPVVRLSTSVGPSGAVPAGYTPERDQYADRCCS
ncbi:MAG: hypothetical protein JWO31_2092 [Phycisphaerales bacterium]|nr:hypothetical protein [Phycisphaerales bacterium]